MAINNSVNTNVGATVALGNLNRTNIELAKVMDRVSTGLRVVGPKEDASSFAIAQGIRAEIKGLAAVRQGLSNGQGVSSVAIVAATEVSNLLADLKKKAIEGMNPGNTTEQQAIIAADYTELIGQVLNFVQQAEFNGRNLLESGSANVNVISDTKGGTMTVRANDLENSVYSLLNAQTLASTAASSAALTVVNSVIATTNVALGQLGADSRALDFQDSFVSALTDAVEEGLGAVVDADLAKESAKLQALQVKQQLAVQTLGIANASPQILLSLFR